MNQILQPSILIATLGVEPQVVTAGLDLLLAQGEAVTVTVILHTVYAAALIAAAVEDVET